MPRAAQVLRGPGEIAEDQATGALVETYERLRRALGVGFVPTVFRMLGRHERYLAAAIEAVGPLLEEPRGSQLSTEVRARARQAALDIQPLTPGSDLAPIGVLINRYNDANPRSLVIMRVLARGLTSTSGVMTSPLAPRTPHALLAEIAACHGGLTVPGLWRELHLLAPQRAAAGWEQVREAAQRPAFARAVAEVIALAEAAGEGWRAPSAAELALSAAQALEIDRILGWFAIVIPTMVVEIECLRAAVDGALSLL
jgi:hypothetical protein